MAKLDYNEAGSMQNADDLNIWYESSSISWHAVQLPGVGAR